MFTGFDNVVSWEREEIFSKHLHFYSLMNIYEFNLFYGETLLTLKFTVYTYTYSVCVCGFHKNQGQAVTAVS
jgi:hypothetical protein